MDTKQALAVFAALASALGVSSVGAMPQDDMERPTGNSDDTQDDAIRVAANEPKPPPVPRLPPIAAMYGVLMPNVIERGSLPEMRALAQRAREALGVLETAEGRTEAKRYGVTKEHIQDVRDKLKLLEASIRELSRQ